MLEIDRVRPITALFCVIVWEHVCCAKRTTTRYGVSSFCLMLETDRIRPIKALFCVLVEIHICYAKCTTTTRGVNSFKVMSDRVYPICWYS